MSTRPVTSSAPLALAFLLAGAVARAGEPAPSPPAPMPEAPETVLVVTGTHTPRKTTDDPVGTERIGARELQSHNVRDASEALAAEPGIQIAQSFRGASISMRGLDSKYVRVLVDGQPLVGQVNDVIDLRRYGMDGVDHIEVVRGAASALYGSDALAGVVNLISRRPKTPLEASGFLQYGSINASAAGVYAGTKRGALGATLALNWFGNNSYDLTPGDPNNATNGDARQVGTGTARLFWNPTETLEVLGFLRFGHFDSRGVDFQAGGVNGALFNRRVGETESAAGAQAQWKPDDKTRVQLLSQANAFARTFFRQQRQGPGLDDQQSLETLERLDLQGDRALAPWVTVTAGSGYQHGAFESPRIRNGGASVNAGWLFAQGELSIAGVAEVVVGGRLDLDATFGNHATPRLAARVKLDAVTPGLSVRGGYGEGFRAPSFGERFLEFHNQVANYIVYGNADLKPETSRDVQAAVEWAPPSATAGKVLPSVRLTAFRNTLTGLIQPIERVDSSLALQRFQYVNYSVGHVGGIEAATRITLGKSVIVDVGYAWLDAHATDATGKDGPLPGRAARQLTGALVVALEQTGTELSMRGQYQLLRSALDPETKLAPLLLANVKVTQNLWKPGGLQLYAVADNLFDDTDVNFLSLPGRTFSVGMQARY